MNHNMVEWVWKNSPLSGSQFLVHLALAAESSKEGYCWSTVNHLATQAKCSYMTVRNAVRTLEQKGYLTIEEMYGHKSVFHLAQIAVETPDDYISDAMLDVVHSASTAS